MRRFVGIALFLGFVSCGRNHSTTTQSSGAVAEDWAPARVRDVHGIPVDSIRGAITRELSTNILDSVAADRKTHVQHLYAAYAGGPLWMGHSGVARERVNALIRAMASADSDGLDARRYGIVRVRGIVDSIADATAPTAARVARADALLTLAYVSLGEDLLTGQIDPRTVEQAWHIPHDEALIDTSLAHALADERVDVAVGRLRPQQPEYTTLRNALALYRAVATYGGWGAQDKGRTLKPRDMASATRIAALRERMRLEQLLPATAPTDSAPRESKATGDSGRASSAAPASGAGGGTAAYDGALAGAVAEFQRRHGIHPDSVLGAQTIDALNVPADARAAQIAANMERYRWLPRTLGSRYILVNVPAFTLQLIDSGKPALSMKVIVGAEYEGRATPAFSDTMTTVVFRPYWNVTDKIAQNEVWPKIQADPGYADRNGYEIYSDHGKSRVRQVPGERNALGLVKFLFPNDFDIYLHDTPQDELFEKDIRAFSHGCIRVEKPADLATAVLGWSPDRVAAAMQGANNREVRVPHPVPVFIVYFTAYARADTVYFGTDLYNRDAALISVLRQ